MEKAIRKFTVLLFRLLWRYDIDDLPSLVETKTSCESKGTLDETRRWQSISFTKLRVEMIERFKKQSGKIPFGYRGENFQVRKPAMSPSSIFPNINGLKGHHSKHGSPFTPLSHSFPVIHPDRAKQENKPY